MRVRISPRGQRGNNMRIEHIAETGHFIIHLEEDHPYQTRRVTPNIIIRLNETGSIIQIELEELSASIPFKQLYEEHGLSNETRQEIDNLLAGA